MRRTGTSSECFSGSMTSRSRASSLSEAGENPLNPLMVGGAISGGRWDSVLSWFCLGVEVDSSFVLAARVEIDEPGKRVYHD